MASAGRRYRFERCSWRWKRAGFATLNLDYASRRKALEALAEDIHPAIQRFADRIDGSVHFVCHSMGGLAGPRLHCQASARTPGPRRDAGHAEQRQRNRRPAEEYWSLPRVFRTGRGSNSAPGGMLRSKRCFRRSIIPSASSPETGRSIQWPGRCCRSRMTDGCRLRTPSSTA